MCHMEDLGSKAKLRIRGHLKTIEDTLLTLEYCQINVGVPFLPATKGRNDLKQHFFTPCADYTRTSLVSVPTTVLDSYAQDLELASQYKWHQISCGDTEESLRILSQSSFLDWLYFTGISFTISFTIAFVASAYSHPITETTFFASLVCGLGAGLPSSLCFLNFFRFVSFARVLREELARREGKFGPHKGLTIRAGSFHMNSSKQTSKIGYQQ